MKGGKLSAPELKGLLDASYDSKVKKVGDFEKDKKLSSSTSKVYRNPITGQVVVAHRGTAGFTDWGNNALYALGGKEAYKLTPRYKEAEKVQRRAEKKYGAENVTTIGHSQGGLQSELLGGRSKEIITLNKATLPFESNKNKNQYDIRSERDVVSGLNPFAKKSKRDVNIKAESYNPLTEHSGDVLNRLGKKRMIGKGPKKASPKKNDEMEFYGSFGKDDGTGVLDRLVPPVEREIRGQIELHYDGTPAGYFRVRALKEQLFRMLVKNGLKGEEEYYDFMDTFYPEPDMGTPQDKLKLKGPNKKETPQSSAKSDKSSMSYGSEGDQFNLEEEFGGSGLRGRKKVYLKGFGRMRGGASRGRQPPRQPREEEDPPSPEPPPTLRRKILNRLEEIRLKFERDEGSVTFTPEERAILEEERNRLTTILSRMRGGVVPATPQKGEVDRYEPDDVAVAEPPNINIYTRLLDDFQINMEDTRALYQTYIDELDELDYDDRVINNIQTKHRYFEITFNQLVDMVNNIQTIPFLRLALQYLNEYDNKELPFVTLQDWRDGALFR